MVDDPESDEEIATALYEAYNSGTPIPPVRGNRELTLPEAYAIQRDVIDRRKPAEGPVAGYKVGFTSAAIREQMAVDEPAFGRLLAGTFIPEGVVDVDQLIEPKIEAELAFRLGEPLSAPVTTAEVLAATDAIVPAVEIVDSRIADWDVTAAEAIADNTLSGRVVFGERVRDPSTLERNLALEGIRVRKNGVQEATGTGADVLGHPGNVVGWLAEALDDRDGRLTGGDVVLTGSTTPLVDLEPGDVVDVQFASFGSVTIRTS